MAAYAALVSLNHILDHVLHLHPSHQIIIPRELIKSFQENVSFCIDFLETYSCRRSQEIEHLVKRIIYAAYAAEDIIESHVVRQIQAKSALFGQSMQMGIKEFLPIPTALENFASIQKELMKIKSREDMEDVRPENSRRASSSRRLIPSGKNIMVGFDELLIKIMSVLATDGSNRQIVSIVGMGGIGKTTLATNVYKNPYIIKYFDIHAWVTVFQEYTELEIVLALLHQIDSTIDPREQELSIDELGDLLHKVLFGRRYLIILDDMWDIQVWYRIKWFLPTNSNGSRILVTTRLLKLAEDLGTCSLHQIGLLDQEKSWDLILQRVFASEDCPVELEEIGKSIAKKCGGLPLALVVIGGLLAKSERTRESWEYVEEDVTSAANCENDGHCIKILSLSYSHLPVHLKPCFLYLAVFPKSFEIHVSRLIRLWVAEGFIKPASDKSLEEVAQEYLEDLVDRNLILVSKRGRTGKMKTIIIHDLVRDLCSREAQKDKFLYIRKLDEPNTSPCKKGERRRSIHIGKMEEKVSQVMRSVRHRWSSSSYSSEQSRSSIAHRLSLLRVLDVVDIYSMDEILQLINSRYITCGIPQDFCVVSPFIFLLWNLQTLVLPGFISLPPEIWLMPQLRHLKMRGITLRDPLDAQMDSQNIIVLENLHTLSTVENFIFRERVIQRIPNLKKLGIRCHATKEIGSFCLSNLVSLHKLESLVLAFKGRTWQNITFPISLKKLTLSSCQIPWEDMSAIGSLPNLEVLNLQPDAAKGDMWNPNEGEFYRLKFLLIDSCELEIWEADSSHFPSLEHLYLGHLSLKEIPMDFAYIPTLQMIDLNHCSSSLFASAKEMSKEREDLGDENVQVRSYPREITFWREENIAGLGDEADTLIKYLHEPSEELEVIAVIGIPGQGKTTLAQKIYHDPRIQSEFPTLIWVYVSRKCSTTEVFLTIMKKFTQLDMSGLTNLELARKVRSYLEKPKFLLFMDDVPNCETWKRIEAALPKSNRLGKVLITSRDEKVAWQANRSREPYKLRFLDPNESWELLQLHVFGKLEDCPSELKAIGMDIAKQCGGVPLAIVVIGGILVEKFSTIGEMKNSWEKILASVRMYHKDDKQKRTANIIALSYKTLPSELRPCFLFMGIFVFKIEARKLIRFWITEGFIEQMPGRSLEEVAEDNLKDLISRNLIMVDESNAKVLEKTCYLHDMIHEFCSNAKVLEKTRDLDDMIHELCIKEAANGLFREEVGKTREGVFTPSVSEIRKPKGPRLHSFLCFSKETII